MTTPSDVSELTQDLCPKLSPELVRKYNIYSPAKDGEKWLIYRPVILALVAKSFGVSSTVTANEPRLVLRALLDFCLYCERNFGATADTVLNFLDSGTVRDFVSVTCANLSRTHARKVTRYLSFAADSLVSTLPDTPVNHVTPYTFEELSLIGSSWVQAQTTDYRKLNASRILSVCLGAGFEGDEAMKLTGAHVQICEPFVWLTSPRDGREIPVHPTYDAPLREGIGAKDFVLFPDNDGRVTSLSRCLLFMQIESVPRVTVQRLIATWQTYLLTQGVTNLRALTGRGKSAESRRTAMKSIDPDFATVTHAYKRPLGAFQEDFVLVPKMVLSRAETVPEWLAESIYDPLGEFDFTVTYPAQAPQDHQPRYPPLRLVHSK